MTSANHQKAEAELSNLLHDAGFASRAATLFPYEKRLLKISRWPVFDDDGIVQRNRASLNCLLEVTEKYKRRMEIKS